MNKCHKNLYLIYSEGRLANRYMMKINKNKADE